jgi:ring-1,2-phenylacetyl-CoA epoxidase subunit PaaB
MSTEAAVFEVFRREKEGAPMVHAGNVTAVSPDLALIYARAVYGRRGESVELWVVPRAAVMVLDDADLLSPALDRSYRTVEGYRMREKFQAVQERLKSSELRVKSKS